MALPPQYGVERDRADSDYDGTEWTELAFIAATDNV